MPCIECLVSAIIEKVRMQQPPKQFGLETEKTSRLERMLQISTPNKIFEDMAVSQPCMGPACAKQIIHAGTGLGMIEESADEDFESKKRLEELEVRRALQEIADDKLETGFGFFCESLSQSMRIHTSKTELENQHIVFMEDGNVNYLKKVFKKMFESELNWHI